ncbi:MAG: hypothetical protein ACYSUY_20735 [Planctomycetota bacterium]
MPIHGAGGYTTGGVFNANGDLAFNNCVFNGNSAQHGGGVGNDYGSVTLTDCAFNGNSASRKGGGMFNSHWGAAAIGCVFSDNSATDGGGISTFWLRLGGLTLTNCTLTGNSASRNGGAVHNYCAPGYQSDLILANCILWGNSADEGPQIAVENDGILSISYCCLQGGQWDVYAPEATLNWLDGNIDMDPCFADEAGGDYYLRSTAGRWDPDSETWVTDANTSPCIDAGNPGCPAELETDPNGSRINMGAFGGTAEASKSPPNSALLADLTNDRKVDSNDLRVFVKYWLESGPCLPSDLNRNKFIDFVDFAVFARELADTSAAEPNITYQIDDCNRDAFELFASEQSSQTRFTVTIEGGYIHFEDMMVANCCPDELALEMTLEDDLIAIYETEYTPAPCWCICNYPVAATLGPFEPGTYTLEVYEDHSGFIGFIGSTIVSIGSTE